MCVWGGGGRDEFWCVYWENVYTFIISPIILKLWKTILKWLYPWVLSKIPLIHTFIIAVRGEGGWLRTDFCWWVWWGYPCIIEIDIYLMDINNWVFVEGNTWYNMYPKKITIAEIKIWNLYSNSLEFIFSWLISKSLGSLLKTITILVY